MTGEVMAAVPGRPYAHPVTAIATRVDQRPGVGHLLRDWRQRRRLSQLELASESGVSTRHVSFVETGRSKPSR